MTSLVDHVREFLYNQRTGPSRDSLGLDSMGKINRIHHGVQWGQKNPNPRAHRSSGKRGLPRFPLNGGPEGWDFSGTTEHQ